MNQVPKKSDQNSIFCLKIHANQQAIKFFRNQKLINRLFSNTCIVLKELLAHLTIIIATSPKEKERYKREQKRLMQRDGNQLFYYCRLFSRLRTYSTSNLSSGNRIISQSRKQGPRLIDLTQYSSSTKSNIQRLLEQWPRNETAIGLDVGTKHVGVSVCDAQGRIAFPLCGFRRGTTINDVNKLKDIVRNHKARAAVLGVPEKQFHDVKQFVLTYGISMLNLSGVKLIVLSNECYTSSLARDGLKNMGQYKTQKYYNGNNSQNIPTTQFTNMQWKKMREKNDRRKHAVDASAAAIILQDVLDLVNESTVGSNQDNNGAR